MGGPCSKGGFLDLENFCQYTRYYIASDLLNGGYQFDEWTFEKFAETKPEHQYHDLLAENLDLEDALIERIDLKRRAYEYAIMNMTENEVMQANYLYSCDSFLEFAPDFRSFLLQNPLFSYRSDVRHYLSGQAGASSLIDQYDSVIIHHADNRDFFEWPIERNGMFMPSVGL